MTRQTAAISAGPGRNRPGRARTRLLTGEAAATAAAHDTHDQPRPDETSRRAIQAADRPHAPPAGNGPAGSPPPAHPAETAGTAPWPTPCQAPTVRPTSPDRYA